MPSQADSSVPENWAYLLRSMLAVWATDEVAAMWGAPPGARLKPASAVFYRPFTRQRDFYEAATRRGPVKPATTQHHARRRFN